MNCDSIVIVVRPGPTYCSKLERHVRDSHQHLFTPHEEDGFIVRSCMHYIVQPLNDKLVWTGKLFQHSFSCFIKLRITFLFHELNIDALLSVWIILSVLRICVLFCELETRLQCWLSLLNTIIHLWAVDQHLIRLFLTSTLRSVSETKIHRR